MPLFGAHMSVAGGCHNAVEAALTAGLTAAGVPGAVLSMRTVVGEVQLDWPAGSVVEMRT